MSSDDLYASPTFEPYTLATGVDVPLAGLDGGPCRRIKLLGTATGDLTLKQASPKDTANPNKAIALDNLAAGDVIDVQATAIVSPPSGLNNLKILVLFCLALLVAIGALGCTPASAQIATNVATGVEAVCLAVASVEAPAVEPICVGADELAIAAIAWAEAHGGARPVITVTSSGVSIVPADLHAALAALPGVKGRKITKRAACAPGTVAP